MAWSGAELADGKHATLLVWVLFGLHLLVFGRDAAVKSQRWMRERYSSKGTEKPQPRVDEAMKLQTEKNFYLQSCLMHHGAAVSVPLLWHAPGARTLCFLAGIAYIVHGCVSCGRITMTASRSRVAFALAYCVLGVSMWETRVLQGPEGTVVQNIYTLSRMILTVVQIDASLHVPAQFGLSVVEVLGALQLNGLSSHVLLLACSQSFVALSCMVVGSLQEASLRENFMAQFRSEDAEAMVQGFRRMLQGLCDGSVLLDGSLNIKSQSQCLSRMLSTKAESFESMHFPHLLAETEKRTFRDFIKASAQNAVEQEGTPPCMRVSLKGREEIPPVSVDLFHVSLSHLYGSDDSYHLLAVRQDAEREYFPDATSFRHELVRSSLALRRQGRPATSITSEGSAASILQTLPQLKEMMLLVEAAREHQDVCQVHLNYKASSPEDPEMPSLRKFIRPTDWESVRARVRGFGEKAAKDPNLKPKHFSKTVWFRVMDQPGRYMQAKKANLKVHDRASASSREDIKVWLHLSDFVLTERQHVEPELEDIDE
ncbi:unnamed protein product [Symbiodinium sp. CCMP2592]|nr:unnamed protein product [Symbiodinium sp. CCMP2592]